MAYIPSIYYICKQPKTNNMRKHLVFLILIAISNSSYSQSWQPLSTGISTSATGGLQKIVRALCVYNNKLIVGGRFDNAGGNFTNNIASWDGTNWSLLGSGLSTNGGIMFGVYALAIYNSELYAGGNFRVSGSDSVYGIAKWNGTTWLPVGGGLRYLPNGIGEATVNTMCVYNGELYVGGNFNRAGTVTVKSIAKWNGSIWSSVANGVTKNHSLGFINELAVYNSELYSYGSFDSVNQAPANNFAKWNGTGWTGLATSFSAGTFGVGQALCVYNSKLYLGNNLTGVSSYDGSNFASVGGGLSGGLATAYTLCSYNNKLIAGGSFSAAGGNQSNFIAVFDGTNWSHLESTSTSSFGLYGGNPDDGIIGVYSSTIYNSDLYVGGDFDYSINPITTLSGIAKLSNTTSLVDQENNRIISIYPNPTYDNLNIVMTDNSRLVTVKVFDTSSRLIKEFKLTNTENKVNININTNDLSIGLYILQVETSEGVVRKTFVKD